MNLFQLQMSTNVQILFQHTIMTTAMKYILLSKHNIITMFIMLC